MGKPVRLPLRQLLPRSDDSCPMSTLPSPVPPVPFPAGPILSCRGRGVAVLGDDIDTDRIIPARFLKCVSFDGLAAGAFADDRSERPGSHPFDRPEHRGATILVVNRNFGCGSSREHAPQALMRWGIRAVIGESFAEIFFGNCLVLGIPCLSVSHHDALAIQAAIAADPATELHLDVEGRELRQEPSIATASNTATGALQRWPLDLAEGPHRMLVSGQWDGTSQLIAHEPELLATAARLPYLSGFGSLQ
jgi:3-isopropylmalate/(R)-2-methylmalate dehydratase small subunit